MLLRVVRGRVLPGRENDFVDISRRQVAQGARAQGLLGFMAGYRRLEGVDSFILVSTWQTADDARRTAGEPETTRAANPLVNTATIEAVEEFELLEPVTEGILDTPGAVLRVTRAAIRPGQRERLLRWLSERRRDVRGEHLLLGWAMGTRQVGGRDDAIAVTAWPSPTMIEAVAEPGRAGKALFSALDQFVTDTTVEQYQAIELQLSDKLADLGSRRLIAARYPSAESAATARDAIGREVESANETPILLAAMGSPGSASANEHLVLVRVSMADYGRAERLIVDHGGEVVLATSEPAGASDEDPAAPAADQPRPASASP